MTDKLQIDVNVYLGKWYCSLWMPLSRVWVGGLIWPEPVVGLNWTLFLSYFARFAKLYAASTQIEEQKDMRLYFSEEEEELSYKKQKLQSTNIIRSQLCLIIKCHKE